MFKAHGQALGCSKCPQRRIWEHASDWLNSFVTEEKKQKRGWTLDQLGFASNGLMNPPSFTLYIGLRDVYDAVLIENLQVSPKPFVC